MKNRITIEKAIEMLRDAVDSQLTESRLTDEEYDRAKTLWYYLTCGWHEVPSWSTPRPGKADDESHTPPSGGGR
jgi:hypothetical protein